MNTFIVKQPNPETQGEDVVIIKTEATDEQFRKVIEFVRLAPNPSLESILPALRAIGYKATPIVTGEAQHYYL